MPVDFSGTWTSAKSENWDKLLDAMKVDKSKMPADLKVTQTVTQKGNDFTIVTTNNKDPSQRRELKFTVGGKISDTIFGHPMESTTAWEGNKLVFTSTDGKGGGSRELVGGQTLVIVNFGGVVAKAWYDKQ